MKPKKMLITGAGGMLGHQAILFFKQHYNVTEFFKETLDITDQTAVKMAFDTIKPDIVLNCAGLRNDKCNNHIKAYNINTIGTYYLAAECKLYNSVFIHISTDYVFDGQKGSAYVETAQANPIGIYGKSKYEGERLALQINSKTFIIRTAWLYGKYGDNFVHKIINVAKQNNEINVVDDQMGNPTNVTELIKIIDLLIKTEQYGIYHGVCSGSVSRYEFAKEIIEIIGSNCKVTAVKTNGLKGIQNTALSNQKIYDEFRYKPVYWTEALKKYLKDEVKDANNIK